MDARDLHAVHNDAVHISEGSKLTWTKHGPDP